MTLEIALTDTAGLTVIENTIEVPEHEFESGATVINVVIGTMPALVEVNGLIVAVPDTGTAPIAAAVLVQV
jgi:hypothetical protein